MMFCCIRQSCALLHQQGKIQLCLLNTGQSSCSPLYIWKVLLNTLCMLCPAVLDGAQQIMPGGCPEWLDGEQAQEIGPADARDDDNEAVLGVCLGIALVLCIICLFSCPALLIRPPQTPHPPSPLRPPNPPTFCLYACPSCISLSGLLQCLSLLSCWPLSPTASYFIPLSASFPPPSVVA